MAVHRRGALWVGSPGPAWAAHHVCIYAGDFHGAPHLYGSEFITRGWVWGPIVVMMLAQFALLRVPVAIASRRPVTQRPLLMTILGAAFMMALLVFGAAISLYAMIAKDEVDYGIFVVLALGIVSWIFWAIYFYVTT